MPDVVRMHVEEDNEILNIDEQILLNIFEE